MNKKMILETGEIIVITKTKGYCCDTVSIRKAYQKDKTIDKVISLSIWDDISFHAYSKDDTKDCIEFDFYITDPLYFPIKRLLSDDKELVIDDDETYNILEKFLLIKKEKNSFKFIFINKAKDEYYDYYKYSTFIKNIGPDPRSKIDDFNIKIRLVNFFRDIERILLEEYHQITIDEYIELLNYYKEQQYTLKKIKK